jgi:hypothetical protein
LLAITPREAPAQFILNSLAVRLEPLMILDLQPSGDDKAKIIPYGVLARWVGRP